LVECSDTSLPLDDATFSKVCCVNVIYFWPDVRAMMVEVLRVLHPGGSFVLCYAEGAPDRVNKIPPEMVERLLGDAGFSSQTTSHGHDRENGDYHCTVAVKP
jgi:ubiquinone/menaquinone biosynthesis C-methylase UbiE